MSRMFRTYPEILNDKSDFEQNFEMLSENESFSKLLDTHYIQIGKLDLKPIDRNEMDVGGGRTRTWKWLGECGERKKA